MNRTKIDIIVLWLSLNILPRKIRINHAQLMVFIVLMMIEKFEKFKYYYLFWTKRVLHERTPRTADVKYYKTYYRRKKSIDTSLSVNCININLPRPVSAVDSRRLSAGSIS
jgi:hypothetical protein